MEPDCFDFEDYNYSLDGESIYDGGIYDASGEVEVDDIFEPDFEEIIEQMAQEWDDSRYDDQYEYGDERPKERE